MTIDLSEREVNALREVLNARNFDLINTLVARHSIELDGVLKKLPERVVIKADWWIKIQPSTSVDEAYKFWDNLVAASHSETDPKKQQIIHRSIRRVKQFLRKKEALKVG